MTHEPLVGVMMVVATLVLFVGAYRRRGADRADGLWPWTRRCLEAVATATLFLAMLWGFRAVLGNNARTFRENHGRVSEANYNSVRTIWGNPHVQRELQVTLRTPQVPPPQSPEGEDEPLEGDATLEGEAETILDGDFIAGFDGKIRMRLNERQKGSALYNGYDADLRLRYDVVNPTERDAIATLYLPLEHQQLLDDVRVSIDDSAVDDFTFTTDGVVFKRPIAAGARVKVEVSYRTRGVEYLYYQVPDRRQIRDFQLELVAEGLSPDDINYPDFCLTPQSIEALDDDEGARLRWTLDRAITTAGMGLALPQPDQPGAEVALVLDRSPYALMLLVVAVGLTLMVRQASVSFLSLALLCAGYCVVFLTMAAASDYAPGFWGSLGLGAAITLGLSWWLYRHHPVRHSVGVLVLFFVTIFPLAGLVPDHRVAFDGAVSVGLIVYLFVIALRRAPTETMHAPIDEHLPTPPA
jgi:hypothetical protein